MLLVTRISSSFVARSTVEMFIAKCTGSSFLARRTGNAFLTRPTGSSFLARRTDNTFLARPTGSSFLARRTDNTFLAGPTGSSFLVSTGDTFRFPSHSNCCCFIFAPLDFPSTFLRTESNLWNSVFPLVRLQWRASRRLELWVSQFRYRQHSHFWDVTQSMVVVGNRRFVTACRSHLYEYVR